MKYIYHENNPLHGIEVTLLLTVYFATDYLYVNYMYICTRTCTCACTLLVVSVETICPCAAVRISKLHRPVYYECSQLEQGSCQPKPHPFKKPHPSKATPTCMSHMVLSSSVERSMPKNSTIDFTLSQYWA